MFRTFTVLIALAVVAVSLSACGQRVMPKAPEGKIYPSRAR